MVAHPRARQGNVEPLAEGQHLDLNVLNPLGTALDDRAVGQAIRPGAPANAIARLEDGHVPASVDKGLGSDQARKARAHHDCGVVIHAHTVP